MIVDRTLQPRSAKQLGSFGPAGGLAPAQVALAPWSTTKPSTIFGAQASFCMDRAIPVCRTTAGPVL